MHFQVWSPGAAIDPPVYLDSNIWVSFVVNTQPRYRACAQLFGELLSRRVPIVFSPLNYHESLWAIAKISYQDLFNNPRSQQWSRDIYRRHRQNIWARYGQRFQLIASLLSSWTAAGALIDAVPSPTASWLGSLDFAPDYTHGLGLEAGDGVHLTLAATYARSFVTADSDFQRAAGQAPAASVNLTIFHIR